MSQSVCTAYSNALGEAFERAVAVVGVQRKWYAFGDERICIQFAGDSLLSRLTPALSHAETESGSVSLTLSVWDTHSTGVAPPSAVWTEHDMLPRGEIRGCSGERVQLTWHTRPSVISCFDRADARACFWIDDAQHTPYYESGAPFRSVLHWWAAQRDKHLLHAAAVGTPDGGVLVAGRGGTGKSNTALACLGRLPYAADDYCMVDLASRVPVVHSLYSTAKINSSDVPLYPHLASAVVNPDRAAGEKALFYLQRCFPDALMPSFPLRAVLVPHRTGRSLTTYSKTSSAAALQALAPSTIFQLPGAGEETFRRIAAMCSSVPCYALYLGTERSQIAEVIVDILAELC